MALFTTAPSKLQLPTAEQALAGRSTPIPVPARHTVLGTPLDGPLPEGHAEAVFGLGCFWGAERKFWQTPGVYSTSVGYAGGHTPNPTYEEVCSGRTGHSEVVRVVFDPAKVSYARPAQGLLREPRSHPGDAAGQRRGDPVPQRRLHLRSGAGPAEAEAARDAYQQALAKAGHTHAHHHRAASSPDVFLRRDLPPAVPGQESRWLLRARWDRGELSNRSGRVGQAGPQRLRWGGRSTDACGLMSQLQYKPLGPLLSGKDSRAFLGLEIFEGKARPIVLVWVPEEVEGDVTLRSGLQQETRRALVLDHPNVLRVHGLARMEEGLARVVEYADGESLRRLLERTGTIPPPIAARIVADAALGVQYAQQAGQEDGRPWVHGDLRPETLLISYGGLTKVSGYGALTLSERRLQALKEAGRTQHSAPEQQLGGRDMVSPQTDVFLLGLILYEAITGSAPFVGASGNDDSTFRMELPLLREGAVPAPLVPIIEKATALKSSQRHPSPQALRDELEQRMGPLPTHHELSRWVSDAMKGDRARAGRQREVDAGIADFAKSQWQRRGDAAYSDVVTNAGLPDVISPDAVKMLRRQAAEAEKARAQKGLTPTQPEMAAVVAKFPAASERTAPAGPRRGRRPGARWDRLRVARVSGLPSPSRCVGPQSSPRPVRCVGPESSRGVRSGASDRRAAAVSGPVRRTGEQPAVTAPPPRPSGVPARGHAPIPGRSAEVARVPRPPSKRSSTTTS